MYVAFCKKKTMCTYIVLALCYCCVISMHIQQHRPLCGSLLATHQNLLSMMLAHKRSTTELVLFDHPVYRTIQMTCT